MKAIPVSIIQKGCIHSKLVLYNLGIQEINHYLVFISIASSLSSGIDTFNANIPTLWPTRSFHSSEFSLNIST